MMVFLWSLAVFLASVFAGLIAGVTLTPRLNARRLTLWWLLTGIFGFGLAFLSYHINLYNDLVGILGLTVLLCAAILFAYRESTAEKLFVGMMSALIANVATFLFCGTTDTFVGARLNLFPNGTPYNVPNILLFIGIKIVVYTIIFVLYIRFMRKRVRDVLVMAGDGIRTYLVVPAVSVVGFYVINLITNSTGIVPTNGWFFPLYLTVCIIFVVEYVQIFNSVRLAAEKMQSEKEKERIGAELNVATQIQADMLPRIFPAFPERKEFDIYASMTPAKEVGGDFYDFFLIDDDHLALVMADVSGKGVPAALFMVIAKTLIKNQSQMCNYSPAKVLMNVNEQLCEGNEAELFVTVWLAIVEISTGRGMAANAGHEHPALRRADGQYELVKYRHSPAIATMEGLRIREHEFELHPGDSLFVYTDGVTEATDSENKLYGTERMLDALNEDPDVSPREVLMAVKRSVDRFVGAAPQFDDITMLCLKYNGAEKENSAEKENGVKAENGVEKENGVKAENSVERENSAKKENGAEKENSAEKGNGTKKENGVKEENVLRVAADTEKLHEVQDFVGAILEAHDCPGATKMLIEVSLEELFVNIAHYAYPEGIGWVEIHAGVTDGIATITLIDGGIPYDPLAKPDPDVTLSAEDRQIGGLGIYMVKKKMDEMTYERRNDKNVLTIRKKL